MQAVRVLHVIDRLWGGGAEASLVELLRHQSTEHARTHVVVALDGDAETARVADTLPCSVVLGPSSGTVAPWDALLVRRAVQRYAPAIVHSSLFRSTLAALLAPRGAVHLVTLTSTEYAVDQPGLPLKRRLGLKVTHRVHGALLRRERVWVHAVSHAVRGAGCRHFHLPLGRVTVVPRGRPDIAAAATRPREEVRGELGLEQHDQIVILLAREHPAKNHTAVLHAVARLRRRWPNLRVLLVGAPGTATPTIDATIAALELDSVVLRLGHRFDVPDLLRASDILACPSLAEGFPGAVIEGLSMGLPIVAFRAPGVDEALGANHPGLAPLGDLAAFENRLSTILDDPHLRAQWSAAARHRYEQEFSMDVYVKRMSDLYARISPDAACRAQTP